MSSCAKPVQFCRHAGPHLLLDQPLDLLVMLELQILQSASVLPLQVSHMLIMLQELSRRRSLYPHKSTMTTSGGCTQLEAPPGASIVISSPTTCPPLLQQLLSAAGCMPCPAAHSCLMSGCISNHLALQLPQLLSCLLLLKGQPGHQGVTLLLRLLQSVLQAPTGQVCYRSSVSKLN